MSKNKTGAPPPAPQSTEASAEGAGPASSPPPSTQGERTAGEGEGSASSAGATTPRPPVTEARNAQRAVRDALERELGVDRQVASFLLGYFLAHRRPLEEVLQAAKELKALPTVWAPVSVSNYLGFRRACEFCNLPIIATGELQAAVSAAAAL